ncbi:hypothetical protein F8M41_010336 [Gigaspora margarita]|uniref:Uncharacterized protein n=1 Tax=Gigaspora margarita TaxID=4874 RepID=A0A8H3X0U0_GIGMA|nr:hypothetical protein F8M41_010336 [Gigaspora margarita]
MSKSKFTCIEEYNTSKENYKEDTTILLSDNNKIDIFEENYKDAFTIDQVTLKNTQIMLNNSDEMDTLEENYEDTFTIDQVTLENA